MFDKEKLTIKNFPHIDRGEDLHHGCHCRLEVAQSRRVDGSSVEAVNDVHQGTSAYEDVSTEDLRLVGLILGGRRGRRVDGHSLADDDVVCQEVGLGFLIIGLLLLRKGIIVGCKDGQVLSCILEEN